MYLFSVKIESVRGKEEIVQTKQRTRRPGAIYQTYDNQNGEIETESTGTTEMIYCHYKQNID